MPLRILKVVANATVSATINPEVSRFFHNVATETTAGTLTIPVEEFETDSGGTATTFPELPTDNSYPELFIDDLKSQ